MVFLLYMPSELVQRAREIIDGIDYLTVATVCADGTPWNSPVYAVHDESYNFYWSSWVEAQHSHNIRSNEHVFIVIYDSTRERGDNHRRCVYIKAKAYELDNDDDVADALRYFKGIGGKELDTATFVGDTLRKMYKAVPEQLWLNDKSESQVTSETIKMRVEVPLDELLA